jgi:putative endonuclease
MYYIYVLRSLKDNKLYTGYSDNLKRRFEEHNKGIVKITKHRRPFILIYYEAYLDQQDATSREKYLKTQWGRNYLKRTLKNYFQNSNKNLTTYKGL